MNKVIETIKSRRTTKAFRRDEQIKDEELELILEAGNWAPTGHNSQPWFFTAIQNRKLIDKLNILAKEAGKSSKDEITQKMCSNEMLDLFYGAPTIVIISYKTEDLTPIEDVSAAAQNMLLAAESLDVASCWNGIVRMFFSGMNTEQREEFGIPENYIPHIVLALGYPKIKVMNIPERTKNYSKIIK
jgi:nitroreductase